MGLSLFAVLRTLGTLTLMIGLFYLLARLGQRKRIAGSKRNLHTSGSEIQILSRKALGQHASVITMRIDRKVLIVGQTQNQMTLLAEYEEIKESLTNEVEDTGIQEPSPGKVDGYGPYRPKAWDAFIENLREMTVRR
ncbi:MAG: flagellar biosynthetic protein FliO [Actinobacteria bacterium]|nr:flagellar biosynthetic protein FliO [Actinomycetota bacterium]